MANEEILEIYDLDGNYLGDQERESFYKEIKEEYRAQGKVTRQVKAIRLLLMNSDGRLFLQKRSRIKKENPGLYDKSVGGHAEKGQSMALTAIRECAEELGFPATVLSANDFAEAIKTTDLNMFGVLKEVERIENFESMRINKNGSIFMQPYINSFFIGYYDGPIKFSDEVSHVEKFDIKDLKTEMKKNPKNFTKDLEFMVKRYEKYLKPMR